MKKKSVTPAGGKDQAGARDAVHAVVTESDGWYVAVARLVPVEDGDRNRALRASRRILERRSRLARASLPELIDTVHEGHRSDEVM